MIGKPPVTRKFRKPHPGTAEQRAKEWNRKQLLRRDGAVCQLCLEPFEKVSEATLDHIQPVSKGGQDKIQNLRLVHEFCNRQRGAGFFKPKAQP